MRQGRSLRKIAHARAQVRRMNEVARVVRHELEAQESVTVLELDTDAQLAWQESPSIGFAREVEA